MWYVIIFCIGTLLGVITSAFVITSGDTEKMEDAYRKGIEEGKRIASKATREDV